MEWLFQNNFYKMSRKSYFKERTIEEITDLKNKKAYHNNDLVQRIEELNKDESIEIRTFIIPGRFRINNNGIEASRKCYKHGNLIALPQYQTLEETLSSYFIPLNFREQAFSKLQKEKQQDINYVGFSWRPVFGRNRTKRIVPFVDISEGVKIFSYAENHSKYKQKNKISGETEEKLGIKVEAYPNAKRVAKEGASVVVEIPSRTVKKSKYKFVLLHVPFIPNDPQDKRNYNLATILSLQPALLRDELGELVVGRTEHQNYDIQYKFEQSREQSPVIRFSSQDITGYLGIIKKQLTEEHNATALNYNPFALPSKHQANFYSKLCNNVFIYDPTLSSKNKLRKLHLAEKSILLARAICHFGHHDFSYWDPVRDGIFKNYSW